jgi:hypothetical protein
MPARCLLLELGSTVIGGVAVWLGQAGGLAPLEERQKEGGATEGADLAAGPSSRSRVGLVSMVGSPL